MFDTVERLKATTLRLLEYCREHEWRGHDPYDALNSPILASLPLVNARVPRLALTQLLKRSPLDLRSVLGVPETENPKAIALFLMALLKLSRLGLVDRGDLVEVMVEKLVALRADNTPYWCWGYSFPWQTLKLLVPKAAPNLVCTVFVANALFDAYEVTRDERVLKMAVSAGEYVRDVLYWSDGDVRAGFSYPVPSLRAQCHNANFLAAALSCRVFAHTGQIEFVEPALKATRYSTAQQRDDGSWSYGESSTQLWVDNFHTGYNLCALRSISEHVPTAEFDRHIRRGFEFYRAHFFREDGAPRYFHNRTYPIDSHSVAQSVITLLRFRDLHTEVSTLAQRVATWALDHLWSEKGYFYYQVLRFYTNKTPYMRWSQAWMLLALSTLLEHSESTTGTSRATSTRTLP
jgi:hypothetical protein